MVYRLAILKRAAAELADLPTDRQRLVKQHVHALADNSRPPGCRKLVGSSEYRIRVGDYRILYLIDEAAKLVTVTRIVHRREAYR